MTVMTARRIARKCCFSLRQTISVVGRPRSLDAPGGIRGRGQTPLGLTPSLRDPSHASFRRRELLSDRKGSYAHLTPLKLSMTAVKSGIIVGLPLVNDIILEGVGSETVRPSFFVGARAPVLFFSRVVFDGDLLIVSPGPVAQRGFGNPTRWAPFASRVHRARGLACVSSSCSEHVLGF